MLLTEKFDYDESKESCGPCPSLSLSLFSSVTFHCLHCLLISKPVFCDSLSCTLHFELVSWQPTWISGIPFLSQGRKCIKEPFMHSTRAGSLLRHCLMYGAVKWKQFEMKKNDVFNEKCDRVFSSGEIFGGKILWLFNQRNKSWILILRAATTNCIEQPRPQLSMALFCSLSSSTHRHYLECIFRSFDWHISFSIENWAICTRYVHVWCMLKSIFA